MGNIEEEFEDMLLKVNEEGETIEVVRTKFFQSISKNIFEFTRR